MLEPFVLTHNVSVPVIMIDSVYGLNRISCLKRGWHPLLCPSTWSIHLWVKYIQQKKGVGRYSTNCTVPQFLQTDLAILLVPLPVLPATRLHIFKHYINDISKLLNQSYKNIKV